MGKIVGIDLGTTYSVMATVDIGGCRILHNTENEPQTRSIVGYYKGDFLIGTPALRRWPMAPEDTIVSVKRLMGRAVTDPEVQKVQEKYLYKIVEPSDGTKDSVRVKLGGKEYSPADISAMILAKLKKDAEFVLGEEVTHAVITVPAYFSEKQKHATKQAGLKAGLRVMKILDEPTAVAIAYGIDTQEKDSKFVLVYDLGGGTFDISVLLMGAGSFSPINKEGDMWLGGDNFDQLIVDDVVEQVKYQYGVDPTQNRQFMALLKGEAQKAKETLSQASKAQIFLPAILKDSSGNIINVESEISREQFEKMIKPLVEKTVALTLKAIENAHLSIDDIDYVIMAGNSTCIPMVQQAMVKLFGEKRVLRKVHPKNSVAMGAAIAAALIQGQYCDVCGHLNDFEADKCEKCGAGLALIEEPDKKIIIKVDKPPIGSIAPFNYGIQTLGDSFSIFIEKGDTVPTPEDKIIVQTFYTVFPNQRIISIPVFGGENKEYASKNEKQGEAFAILPPGLPQGTPIRIKLWLNREELFELSAHLEDGTDLKPWILRGEMDQKVRDLLLKCEEASSKIENIISPEQKKELEKSRNEVFEALKNKNFEEAEKKAEELLKEVEKIEPLPPLDPVELLIGYATYLINEYSWLIKKDDIYQMNKLIGELREAHARKNVKLMEEIANELGALIDGLVQTTDLSGQPIPTLLGLLVTFHLVIESIIQPVDIAKANKLREELLNLENALRNRHPNAMDMLNLFSEKLMRTIEETQKKLPAEMMRCPVCGHQNPPGTRYCGKCKTDLLWKIAKERIPTSSGKIS